MNDACIATRSSLRRFLFATEIVAEGTPARLKVFVGAVQMNDFSAASSEMQEKTMWGRSDNLMSQ